MTDYSMDNADEKIGSSRDPLNSREGESQRGNIISSQYLTSHLRS